MQSVPFITSQPEPVTEQAPIAPRRGTFYLSHDLGWGGAETLDPITASPFDHASMLSYSRLLRFNREGEVEGEIAENWEANADASAWTFTLRRGVLFHDGTELTSKDVRFTIERIFDPALESPVASVLSMYESAELIDDYTIRFHLNSTAVDFPLLLTDRRMRILPQDVGDTVPWGIGSGPFVLESFDPTGITKFIAFDDYWEGPPGLGAVESIALPDVSSQVQALHAGELDYVNGMSQKDRRIFDGRAAFQIQNVPTGNWTGMIFRTDVAPFDDVRVRKALRLVVDREAMLNLALGEGQGVVACDSPVAPGDPYRAELECAPDIEQARALLVEAGYENGLRFTLMSSTLNDAWMPMAEVYQFQAAKAGIHIKLETVSADGYWSDVWMTEPAVMTSWVARPAAQVLSEAYRSTAKWNESYWKNDDLDALLDKASSTLDFEERKEIYVSIQQLLFDEGGSLIPFHFNRTRGISTNVIGIDPVNEDQVRWHEVEKN